MKRSPLPRSGPPKRRRAIRRIGKRTASVRDLDHLLRQVVLERDGYRCRRCYIGERPGRGFALQAAHIFGKGAHRNLRYELDNLICLCQPCHWWWHQFGLAREVEDRPNEVREWCLEQLGPEHLARLEWLARARTGGTDPTLLRIYLEQQLKNLKQRSVARGGSTQATEGSAREPKKARGRPTSS